MAKCGLGASGRSTTVQWVVALWSNLLFSTLVHAQIVPDATLGTQVNGDLTAPCTGFCAITDGSTRGSNLFHSFRQFSLPNGDFAAFVINPTIQNVIVRVTGVGQPFISNINGAIATTDPTFANLIPTNFFLLNPNGIVFGSNARIFVGGSFLASTAERMLFQDGTVFDTRNPTPNPLLTVSVPTGLQFGSTPAAIRMKDSFPFTGGRDVAIVGGDVMLDNSTVVAPGRRLELGAVGENGVVDLRRNGDRLSLNLATGTPLRDVTLSNGSIVDAGASNGGGDVVVTGRNITLGGSSILNGIFFGLDNTMTNQAGDITIDAAANLQLSQGSFINNLVGFNAIGQGGNISIMASDIRVRDGSAIGADTLGNGNAGNVQVIAKTISLDGASLDGQSVSGIFSQVFDNARGSGGDVNVKTGVLTVMNGAVVSAQTRGNGNGGNVRVTADTITLDGTTPNQRLGGIGSEVVGTGRGGNVTVQADSLTILNGAVVSASTIGAGDAGNISVIANEINLDGTAANGQFASAIRSEVAGVGKGGNVVVQVGSLTVTNGAQVSANNIGGVGNAGNVSVTAGKIVLNGTKPNQNPGGIGSEVVGTGRGGNITVQADSLTVLNGAVVSASTFGNGDAGNISVTANEVSLDGIASNGLFVSTIRSEVAGTGKGGDITIQAGSLTITNGAVVSAATFGIGDAGNVQVIANEIALDGTSSNGLVVSAIVSAVAGNAVGDGGNVTLTTGSLSVNNGARITASTLGTGDAGNVRVTANSIILDGTAPNGGLGSSIISQVEPMATGDGGDVTLTTNTLNVTSGAVVSAATLGIGDAGNVRVTANTIALDGTSPSGQFASGIRSGVGFTGSGRGGDVIVGTGSLTVTNGAEVDATTFGNGDAGNVRVTANTITLDGATPNGQSVSGIGSEVGFTGSGRGGNVTLETNLLTATNGAVVTVSAFGNGTAGNVNITADTIRLDRSGIRSFALSGDGANITLNVRDLLLMRRGSQISTSAGLAGAGGNGGNITISSPRGFIVGVKGENSDITANAFTGSGGRVNITAQGIYGLQFRPKLTEFSDITASSTFGVSGVVAINTLGIDPSRGLQQLPASLIDPSNRIDQKCAVGSGFRRSSFTVTGRGGLPESPLEPLQSGEGIASWVEVETENTQSSTLSPLPYSSTPPPSHPSTPSLLVEADSLMVGKDGGIQLVARIAEQGNWRLPTCASMQEQDR